MSERQAHDEVRVASRGRRTRLLRLTIAAVAVVSLTAVALIATARDSSSPPQPRSARATSIAQGISTLLAGIPQHANVLGNPRAPVTLQWFGDLECPICKEFTLGALPAIIQRWVLAGHLKIEYRAMETATREPPVFKAQQIAALAAGMQSKMWNFLETFYHAQGEEDSGYVSESYIRGIADQVPGLNVALWEDDRHDPQLAEQLVLDAQAVKRGRFRGTPTFLIGRSAGTGTKASSRTVTDARQLEAVIKGLGG